MVDSHPVFCDHAEEGNWDNDANVVSGRPFYLAAEMWDAYFEFLRLHPEHMEVFCRGFQVCTGIIFVFMVHMVLVSLLSMLKTYYHLQLEQGGAPGVYEECTTGEWIWMRENLAGLMAAEEHAPVIGSGDCRRR